MPNRDKTGPNGDGPKTGKRGQTQQGTQQGQGRGQGRGQGKGKK